MPIKPENRKLYPPNWRELSRRIRCERAGNKCEQCGAPNGQLIGRATGVYMVDNGDVFDDATGEARGACRLSEFEETYGPWRMVRVVLTVAHLNHDPSDCRDENLKAWCQQCHLRYDAEHHAENARKTRRGRRAAGELF